jgi:catechol 2,3-dioxygenase-like lactoylglutathione lyase family enzyme
MDHVVIPIWEAEKSVAFYRDVLGLKLTGSYSGDDWGGYPWLMLILTLADKRQIVLTHFAGARRAPRDKLPKDARHIAMGETGALDPWRDRLRKAGVAFWEEDHGGQTSLYFEDPNGVVLEITSPPTAPDVAHNARALTQALEWIRRRGACGAPFRRRRDRHIQGDGHEGEADRRQHRRAGRRRGQALLSGRSRPRPPDGSWLDRDLWRIARRAGSSELRVRGRLGRAGSRPLDRSR